mmetsp:Transcript_87846/g.139496  ORF Transcript_87846/g.139496 Transcript_87846/m.139496 type:complete len:252 (-) Transcript_87846:357-1112(-)
MLIDVFLSTWICPIQDFQLKNIHARVHFKCHGRRIPLWVALPGNGCRDLLLSCCLPLTSDSNLHSRAWLSMQSRANAVGQARCSIDPKGQNTNAPSSDSSKLLGSLSKGRQARQASLLQRSPQPGHLRLLTSAGQPAEEGIVFPAFHATLPGSIQRTLVLTSRISASILLIPAMVHIFPVVIESANGSFGEGWKGHEMSSHLGFLQKFNISFRNFGTFLTKMSLAHPMEGVVLPSIAPLVLCSRGSLLGTV